MAGIVGSKAARGNAGLGNTTTVGPYTVHAFTTTGANTFTPATTGFIDILLVGGGGGAGNGPNGAGGGGAGATLFRKFIPVTASTPYPISVGAGGGTAVSGTPTTFIYSGITTTASGGGFGGPDGVPGSGVPAPTASGGGMGRYGPPAGIPSTVGTGAGVIGLGFPGGSSSPNPYSSGGGGGAGGVGLTGGPGGPGAGGPGVPISYFTGTPTDMASVGGFGYPNPSSGVTSTSYGSGGAANGGTPENGRPGVAYIRYI